MTDDQLKAIMPRLPAAKREAFLPFMQAAMREFEVNSPAREAAFAAQLAHESGQFQFMEEIWGPTDAQRRYEPPGTLATRLGNTNRATASASRDAGRSRSPAARTTPGSAACSPSISLPRRSAPRSLNSVSGSPRCSGERRSSTSWRTRSRPTLSRKSPAASTADSTGWPTARLSMPSRKRCSASRHPRCPAAAGRSPSRVPDPVFTRGQEAIAADEEEPQSRTRAPRAAKKTPTRRATPKKKQQRTPARARRKSARR